MSYEHCERHDEDATNGCHKCALVYFSDREERLFRAAQDFVAHRMDAGSGMRLRDAAYDFVRAADALSRAS